jgi:hypothetical protein
MKPARTDQEAASTVRAWCRQSEVEFSEETPGRFAIVLPGEKKLRTTVAVSVGPEVATIEAFVMRQPDQNADRINTWLLERNRRIFGLAYALDHLGDIFLVAALPSSCLTLDDLDRLMGSVLEHADAPFNSLLELGFEDAIRAEWRWRLAAGESTANLAAFPHLAPPDAPARRHAGDPDHA